MKKKREDLLSAVLERLHMLKIMVKVKRLSTITVIDDHEYVTYTTLVEVEQL